ncbi:MAG: glutathione peroxidase [Bacteroidetes bacterium]|nr:glutathione peroxidase [Bacteroidota bacterium]
MNIYDFKMKTLEGKEIDFKQYKDHVLLIVNTASACGFTPQFTGLESLHKEFKGRNFEILGFPCNQFQNQDPGNADEILNFCQRNYGVSFTMFEKIDVNGDDAHELYKYLKSEKSGLIGKDIKWNFTKFLLNRNGEVVERFAPSTKPEKIKPYIEKLL